MAALIKHLEDHPDDGRGWFLLGRAYLSSDRYAEAVDALRRANDLLPGQPEVAAAYGEALVTAADGQLTEEASRLFAKVLAEDARNPQARYFLGLAKAQSGDAVGALRDWVGLVILSPADAPWLPSVRQQILALAARAGVDPATLAPSAEARALAGGSDVAPRENAEGAPSAEARAALIRAMVDRLARRLEQDPNDPDGWARLARAYEVLGETAKADEARARARSLASPSVR